MSKGKLTAAVKDRRATRVNIARAAQLMDMKYSSIREAMDRGYIRATVRYEGSNGRTGRLTTIGDLEDFRLVLIERYSAYNSEHHAAKVESLQSIGDLSDIAT
jgi:molybdenum-dependent DNA-binding transcriptional regulator ModE